MDDNIGPHLSGSDCPLLSFGPLYIVCGVRERSLPHFIWTMGLLCPFFHNFVLFWAFDFLFALTLFHVVDVLIVFCCTFVVIYSYGWLLFHCCALIYLFVFSILGVRLIILGISSRGFCLSVAWWCEAGGSAASSQGRSFIHRRL